MRNVCEKKLKIVIGNITYNHVLFQVLQSHSAHQQVLLHQLRYRLEEHE